MACRMDRRSEHLLVTRGIVLWMENRDMHIVELARYVRAYKRRETSHNDTDKVDRLKRIVAVIAIHSARLISYATLNFFKNFCSRYLRDMSNVPSIFFSEAYSRSSSQ